MRQMAAARSPLAVLLAHALAKPGAWEDHPWGETVAKVGKKVFVFLGKSEGGGFSMSAKLPVTHPTALAQPFARPTGYGLGASGWVTAAFAGGAKVPLDLLRQWIDESYRAVAPKKIAATAGETPAPPRKRRGAAAGPHAKRGRAAASVRRR
jgi:predicted DNA-binding protein (MmcQ/YjbR family)